uniref:Uncharacterized protein n=1 Tax=viral metagenome TaxID=1070528 RepID=A0A6C0JRS6_9ZZZZ
MFDDFDVNDVQEFTGNDAKSWYIYTEFESLDFVRVGNTKYENVYFYTPYSIPVLGKVDKEVHFLVDLDKKVVIPGPWDEYSPNNNKQVTTAQKQEIHRLVTLYVFNQGGKALVDFMLTKEWTTNELRNRINSLTIKSNGTESIAKIKRLRRKQQDRENTKRMKKSTIKFTEEYSE